MAVDIVASLLAYLPGYMLGFFWDSIGRALILTVYGGGYRGRFFGLPSRTTLGPFLVRGVP